MSPRFIHTKTTTTRPLLIERAPRTDLVIILAVYQLIPTLDYNQEAGFVLWFMRTLLLHVLSLGIEKEVGGGKTLKVCTSSF